jgi:hypothetical protein
MDATNAQCPSSNVSADAIDEPYRFGRRPTVRFPFPFTDRQFARLLVLRSRYEVLADDDTPELAA